MPPAGTSLPGTSTTCAPGNATSLGCTCSRRGPGASPCNAAAPDFRQRMWGHIMVRGPPFLGSWGPVPPVDRAQCPRWSGTTPRCARMCPPPAHPSVTSTFCGTFLVRRTLRDTTRWPWPWPSLQSAWMVRESALVREGIGGSQLCAGTGQGMHVWGASPSCSPAWPRPAGWPRSRWGTQTGRDTTARVLPGVQHAPPTEGGCAACPSHDLMEG